MSYPHEYYYTKDHEWISYQDKVAIVGITEFAQSELGELVFVDLPKIAAQVSAGGAFCVVESTKAASDVYAPVTGKVLEVNTTLTSEPNLINKDPHQAGWIAKLVDVSEDEIKKLLTQSQYLELVGA